MAISIQTDPKRLAEVFDEYVVVPEFQREFSWTKKEVRALLEDFNNEYTENEASTEFFLGSFILTKAENGTYEVIDGQQRITTSLLVLCAMRDYYSELTSGSKIDDVDKAIGTSRTSRKTGLEERNIRVRLNYPDGDQVLRQIGLSGVVEDASQKIKKKSKTQQLILEAYDTIRDWLRGEYSDPEELRKFAVNFLQGIIVVRVVCGDLQTGVRVFELINDRGSKLKAIDLVKNMLFVESSDDASDSQKLKAQWNQFQRELKSCESQPSRFLRYFIMSQFEDKIIRKNDVLDWFKERRKEKKRPFRGGWKELMKELDQSCESYSSFINCKSIEGSEVASLRNLRLLGGSGLRQHFIVLMAARHLDEAPFRRLAVAVERLMFSYLFAEIHPRGYEPTFASWADELRGLSTMKAVEGFVNDKINREILRIAPDLEDALEKAGDQMPKRHQQYTLAKVEAYLRSIVKNEDVHDFCLDDTVFRASRYDVDHIQPQSSKQTFANTTSDKSGDAIHLLGNLTLLEEPLDKSAQDIGFQEKKPYYSKSQIYLTRTIVDDLSAGQGGRFVTMSKKVKQYPVWDESSIRRRHEMLVRLIVEILDLPISKYRQ